MCTVNSTQVDKKGDILRCTSSSKRNIVFCICPAHILYFQNSQLVSIQAFVTPHPLCFNKSFPHHTLRNVSSTMRSLATSPSSTGPCNPHGTQSNVLHTLWPKQHLGPVLTELESDHNAQALCKAQILPCLWTRGNLWRRGCQPWHY